MIYETLQILKEQLEAHFEEVGLGKIVILENIALWESGNTNASKLEGNVAITLLKIEEEASLKNNPTYKMKNGKPEYYNPPVNLNLYLLVSANCDSYDKSLRSISTVIKFFQGKKIFTSANTVYNRTNVAFELFDYFRFILELYTPSFAELNNVWSTLGGRQMPSAIYRVQLIQLEQDKKLSTSEVITHVGGDLNDIR